VPVVNVNGCSKIVCVNNFRGVSISAVESKIFDYCITSFLSNISFHRTINCVLRKQWDALMLFIL